MTASHKPYIAIFGPTGSGKSKLALALASQIPSEIIGCDSVQIYKGFDIGSAKPTREEQNQVPHHLIDICHWSEDFDADRYRKEALTALKNSWSRGNMPIIVGGTGLYLRALTGDRWDPQPSGDSKLRSELEAQPSEKLYNQLQALNPKRAKEIHLNDRYRIVRALEIALQPKVQNNGLLPSHKPALSLFISPPREKLIIKIGERIREMLLCGWVEEVKSLLNEGCPPTAKPMQSIGYKSVCEALLKDKALSNNSLHELQEEIWIRTRQYAKRQMTWFRKVPYDIQINDIDDIINGPGIKSLLEKIQSLI